MLLANNAWFSQESLRISVPSTYCCYLFTFRHWSNWWQVRCEPYVQMYRGAPAVHDCVPKRILSPLLTLKASWLVVRPLSFCVSPRVNLALTESQQSRTYSVREEERRSSCTTANAIVHWSVQAESDLQSLQVDMKQISSTFSVFSKNRSNVFMYQVNSLGKSQWFPFNLSIILRKGCDVNSTH